MKKFTVFILSFAALFIALQVGSGLILTAFYTPDFTSISNDLSQEVAFGSASNPLLLALLTAAVAYFISQKKFTVSITQTN